MIDTYLLNNKSENTDIKRVSDPQQTDFERKYIRIRKKYVYFFTNLKSNYNTDLKANIV